MAAIIAESSIVRYREVADPTCEYLNVTAAATGDWLFSKWKFVDAVFISPNSASWAAADAYAATVSESNKITFTLVGTATRPFWCTIYGHD